MCRTSRLILILTIFTTLVLLSACPGETGEDPYDKGYNLGYQHGYEMGSYVGFREGCEIGYDRGRYEASIRLAPSMDWFFTDYPQYR